MHMHANAVYLGRAAQAAASVYDGKVSECGGISQRVTDKLQELLQNFLCTSCARYAYSQHRSAWSWKFTWPRSMPFRM